MNLHEFQSKQLFSNYGIPIPAGKPAYTVEEAVAAAKQLGGERWVVKAQVHAGGRGKGGGVKRVENPQQLQAAAKALLGSRLVTPQTDARGLPINVLLVEACSTIERELYVGVLVDRAKERVVMMASASGGMDIEAVAATTPEKILKTFVDPVVGLQAYQCRQMAFKLGLAAKQVGSFSKIMLALYKLFCENDASLVEINPLIVTGEQALIALDAKINLDDNALYRHSELASLRDASQEDEKEHAAHQHDLNYVALDGDIGCMVNGAGLAMATMDLIKLSGGQPANFLDVGGGYDSRTCCGSLQDYSFRRKGKSNPGKYLWWYRTL